MFQYHKLQIRKPFEMRSPPLISLVTGDCSFQFMNYALASSVLFPFGRERERENISVFHLRRINSFPKSVIFISQEPNQANKKNKFHVQGLIFLWATQNKRHSYTIVLFIHTQMYFLRWSAFPLQRRDGCRCPSRHRLRPL